MCRWHLVANSMRSENFVQNAGGELKNLQFRCEMTHVYHQQQRARSLRMLAGRNGSLLLTDVLLSWTHLYKKIKQQKLQAQSQEKVIQKYAKQAFGKFIQQDTSSLVSAIFWELRLNANHERHARMRESALHR